MNEGRLSCRRLRLRFPGQRHRLFDGAELTIEKGQTVGLFGPSGSGKSSFLKCLNGLIPWLMPGEISGKLRLGEVALEDLDPGQRAYLISSCLDRPEAQLFLGTPAQELEHACRRRPGTLGCRELEETLEIGEIRDRPIRRLSSGEIQRVALATACAGGGRPVLLDEALSHLDDSGVAALRQLMRRSLAQGGSFLVAEHAGWRFEGDIDHWYRIREGRVEAVTPPEVPELKAPRHSPGERLVLRAQALSAGHGSRNLFDGVDLELHEGEIILISGTNGVGKSTLARILGGYLRPSSGKMSGVGRRILMSARSKLQLRAPRVIDEIQKKGMTVSEVGRILRRHGLEALAARAPWSLSRGERQRLLHAAYDIYRPAVMILDEPEQGLGPADLRRLVKLIHRRAESGRAYILISHRRELRAVAHRHLCLQQRNLEEFADV